MVDKGYEYYERGLAAVANLRLVFNTMDELEAFLDNRAIHDNGMRRCYPGLARARAAFRDLAAQAADLVDDRMSLGWVLRNYRKAWEFYRDNLARRKNPEELAMWMLAHHYGKDAGRNAGKTLLSLFADIERKGIDTGFLALLLLRALPSYESKAGDVRDIDEQFERVTDFLDKFTRNLGAIKALAVIIKAKHEPRKCRLTLIDHTVSILEVYEAYSNPANMDKEVRTLRERAVGLQLDGFWRSSQSNEFWQIEQTVNQGTYFAWQYVREDAHLLHRIKYTLSLVDNDDGTMTAYLAHPMATPHLVMGCQDREADSAWYVSPMPEGKVPAALRLILNIPSRHWPGEIALTRIAEGEDADRYEALVKTATIIDPYEEYDYEFVPSVYAIIHEWVFVHDNDEDCDYQLPRHTEDGFESIGLDDNVGILSMRGRRYLAVDEKLMYIPLEAAELARHGIEKSR